jgi:hypothetical protein
MPVPEDLNNLAKLLATLGFTFDPSRPTAIAIRGNQLTWSATAAGTAADTAELALWTYSLPANALLENGRGVKIRACVNLAATATTKTTKLYFGSTVIATRAAADNDSDLWIEATVLRTGGATQVASSLVVNRNTAATLVLVTAPTETLTSAVTIKITGQNGTGNLNDIVFKHVSVELF